MTFRDYAIVILKLVLFFVKKCFAEWLLNIGAVSYKAAKQEVIIFKQWNFLTFCIRHILMLRKNAGSSNFEGGIQLECLQGSISMMHTVVYTIF